MIRNQALRLAFLTIFTLAGAGATTITYSGVDPNRSFDIWFTASYVTGDQLLNGQPSPNDQTIDVNLTAGVANLLIDGLYLTDAICLDFFTLISNGVYDVNLLGPDAVSSGTRVAWMLHNTLPTINALADSTEKQMRGAAFQLAVWDIVHDNGDGFFAGRIRGSAQTDNLVLSYAASYLSSSNGQSQAAGIVYQNVAGSDVSQLLMSDAPEPSTYAMLLTGGAMLGLWRRRRAS